MEKFTFYYEITASGAKYCETIKADNFRIARNEFYKNHTTPFLRLDAIWNDTTATRLFYRA